MKPRVRSASPPRRECEVQARALVLDSRASALPAARLRPHRRSCPYRGKMPRFATRSRRIPHESRIGLLGIRVADATALDPDGGFYPRCTRSRSDDLGVNPREHHHRSKAFPIRRSVVRRGGHPRGSPPVSHMGRVRRRGATGRPAPPGSLVCASRRRNRDSRAGGARAVQRGRLTRVLGRSGTYTVRLSRRRHQACARFARIVATNRCSRAWTCC